MSPIRSWRAAVCAATLVLSCSSIGLADPTAGDVATAKALVKEGRSLRDSGDHRSALEKFRAAYALVPTPITGSDLAEEFASNGLLVEARETYLDVVKMPAKAGEKKEYAEARDRAATRAEELSHRIATLTLRVPGTTSTSALVVSLDGHEIPAAALGLPRKVNPGEHRISTRVGAASPEERLVTIGDGESLDFEVTVGASPVAPAPVAAAPAAADATTPVAATPVPPGLRDSGTMTSGSTGRTVGWALLVGGAVGVGVGSYLAFSAKSRYDESSPYCAGGFCQQPGLDIQADAQSKGNVATIVFIGGAALAAGGLVLVLVSRPPTSSHEAKVGDASGSLTLALGFSSLSLGGSF